MTVRQRMILFGLIVVAIAAGCGGGSSSTTGGGGGGSTSSVSGSISFVGIWTGPEQKSFQAVIDAFNQQYPNVDVKYTSAGNNITTVLSTAVQGGNPPDLADVAQPGFVNDLQKKGALQPIEFARSVIEQNFGTSGAQLGEIDGKLYGLLFKASNKSTIWYNVSAFQNAGVQPAKTWPELLQDAKTIHASGLPAYSIGGSEGWTLTDLFENIYLRQAGPDMYDKLSKHEIKWTDPSVIAALKTMGQVLSDTSNIAGGTSGALQTDFATSVNNVLTPSNPKAAMVMEGDFVPGTATTGAKAGTDYNVFPFPSINGSPSVTEVAGDEIIMFKDSPAAEAFLKYLATPQAAEVWIKRGGFGTLNKKVPLSDYTDPISHTVQQALATSTASRFDLSDLQPAAFGATVGQGEFKIFQDFLKSPSNVTGIAQELESAAAKAYK
ncbi:MAG TPA: extracellular solute-binding protein [Gaiellales bacterium]|nr:extracellular solute-binding protein [Gaiellales bacterium]